MTERMVTNFCRECMERQADLWRTNKRLIEVLEEKIELAKENERLRKAFQNLMLAVTNAMEAQ